LCLAQSADLDIVRLSDTETTTQTGNETMKKNLTATKREETLRHSIMECVKANNLPVTGDFWLMLVFRTESQLRTIAHEIGIPVTV
jgi:hypothetical protein